MPRTSERKLIKRRVDELARWAERNPAKERIATDSEVPGFVARARRGRIAFELRYSAGAGRRRILLGEFGALTVERARELARDAYGQVRGGTDPQTARRARKCEEALRDRTLADAAAAYLEDFAERAEIPGAKGRRSGHTEAARLLAKARSVRPTLFARSFAEIEPADIEGLQRAMRGTPSQANRVVGALHAVFSFGERQREHGKPWRPMGSNPCRPVARFREDGRRVPLTLEEIERLGAALREAEALWCAPRISNRRPHGAEEPSAVLAIRLLVLTGMRRSEITGHESTKRREEGADGLRWRDVDLEARVIRLHVAKSGPRDVFLGRAAVELLRVAKQAGATPEGFVIPSHGNHGRPFVGLDRVRERLFARAGIRAETGRRKDLHSLRKTFATLAERDGSKAQAAVLLGHRGAGDVTDLYISPEDLDVLRLADRVTETLAARLAGKPSADVLPFDSPAVRRA